MFVSRAGWQTGCYVARVVVRHRANDGQLVHNAGRVRHDFRKTDARHAGRNRTELAADGRWSGRLRVERLLLAHSTRQEDEDDAFGRPFLTLVIFDIRLGLLKEKKIRERHSDSADETDVQEISPREKMSHGMEPPIEKTCRNNFGKWRSLWIAVENGLSRYKCEMRSGVCDELGNPTTSRSVDSAVFFGNPEYIAHAKEGQLKLPFRTLLLIPQFRI